MAVPEWVDRLRPGSFTSPSGIVSNFKVDLLTRIGGKKASNHEILNKNEAIPQDQGNRSVSYPMEVYFVGSNGDTEANIFFKSLGEKYTASTPGILHHPETSWGDIAVMPFEFQQSQQLVTGGGVFRVPVEFREIPQARFPVSIGVDQSEITADITALEETLEAANEQINIDDPGVFAEFRAKINDVVDVVSDAVGTIADGVDEVGDTFRLIQADIDSALSIGVDAIQIMSQVNNLIRLPAQIVDSTLNKIQAYGTMIEDMLISFANAFTTQDEQTQINNATIFQSLLYFSSGAISEAGLFTEYETRDAAGDALDFINDAFDLSEQRLSEISQLLPNFIPDHNTGLATLLIIGDTNSILIDRSFDLKAKQTVILSGPSDAITETWRFYKDMSKLDFFIRTNNLQDNEILEIPSGTEIVAYL